MYNLPNVKQENMDKSFKYRAPEENTLNFSFFFLFLLFFPYKHKMIEMILFSDMYL